MVTEQFAPYGNSNLHFTVTEQFSPYGNSNLQFVMTEHFVQTSILQVSGMEGTLAVCLMFSSCFVNGSAV
jgi:hypothetical protein